VADRPIDRATIRAEHAVVPVTRGSGGVCVRVERGLAPDADVTISLGGEREVRGRALPRPSGELLAVVTTVNDVHFGELEAGRIDELPEGPIRRAAPGEPPYPELMNHAAVADMAATDPSAATVKGDLPDDAPDDEWETLAASFRPPFGPPPPAVHLGVSRGASRPRVVSRWVRSVPSSSSGVSLLSATDTGLAGWRPSG